MERVQIPGEAQPGPGISHETKPAPSAPACGDSVGPRDTQNFFLTAPQALWSTRPESFWTYPLFCKSLERSLLLFRKGVGACNHLRKGGPAVHVIYSWSGTSLGPGESPSSALFNASRLFMFVNNCFLGPFPHNSK